MEEKRSSGRAKRQIKNQDEGKWDCSVCTFKNPPEAFKCEMCDVRKGTSTRKPRANQQIVAAQIAQQYAPPPPLKKERTERSAPSATHVPSSLKLDPDYLKDDDEQTDEEILPSKGSRTHLDSSSSSSTHSHTSTQRTKKPRPPRLKNIDRSSAQHMAVTVNNVTVIITDYKPKERRISTDSHHHNNNTNSTNLNRDIDRESDSQSVNDTRQQNGEHLSEFEY